MYKELEILKFKCLQIFLSNYFSIRLRWSPAVFLFTFSPKGSRARSWIFQKILEPCRNIKELLHQIKLSPFRTRAQNLNDAGVYRLNFKFIFFLTSINLKHSRKFWTRIFFRSFLSEWHLHLAQWTLNDPIYDTQSGWISWKIRSEIFRVSRLLRKNLTGWNYQELFSVKKF